MLKHCIRGTVIDLGPPPTLTVDDAVPTGLNPCQVEGDGSRGAGRRKETRGMEGKTERNEGMGGWVMFSLLRIHVPHNTWLILSLGSYNSFCRSNHRWTRTPLDHSSFAVADNKNAGVPIKWCIVCASCSFICPWTALYVDKKCTGGVLSDRHKQYNWKQ